MIDKVKCLITQMLLMPAPMEYLRYEKILRRAIEEECGYRFKSNFEAAMSTALYILNIPYAYEPLKLLFTAGNKVITYTPDFVLGMQHENSKILIETHGSAFIDKEFLQKMDAFMSSSVSDPYYIILVTDKRPKKPNKLKIELNKYGYLWDDICDDVWCIPYALERNMPLTASTGKGTIFSMLRDLKENKSVSIIDEKQVIQKSITQKSIY